MRALSLMSSDTSHCLNMPVLWFNKNTEDVPTIPPSVFSSCVVQSTSEKRRLEWNVKLQRRSKSLKKSKTTVNEGLIYSNPRPLAISSFMVQSAAQLNGPVHEPKLPPTPNDPFSRCQSTSEAWKSPFGALQLLQSRMAAKKISCAKTGGAAWSREKQPRNQLPFYTPMGLKLAYFVDLI